ncbi:MAG: sxtJ [Pelagibacteraceae bacterium]|nr:sxtJ [Pelagibacteraceae bacterium]|tara:strand:+ start:36415 stop:36825 length:411 start_codon:yes stop_codon:yes gene_type:complete
MFEEIKNIKTSKKDIKSFGITMGLILSLLSLMLFYYNHLLYQNILIIAAVFLGLGILFPVILKPLYIGWMIFAVILGWIMTRVILSIVFYLIMTPIGLIVKLLGKDFLALKISDSKTYWNNRDNYTEKNQNYEKQF